MMLKKQTNSGLIDKKRFLELVTKVLLNESTSEEKTRLNDLLKNDEYNKLFVWVSNKIEDYKVSTDNYEFNIKRGLNKLTEKIQIYESSFIWEKENSNIFKHHTSFLKIAASIIFFVLVSTSTLYFFNFFEKHPQKIILNEKKTKSGQKSILTLLDGTKITLNGNSSLKYPTRFGEYSREVYLEGEAYFEVVHISKKPFIVHTGEVSTWVLGTKFNVTAFPKEKMIKVSLVEGKVAVSNNNENEKGESINLLPKQQYSFDTKQKKVSVKEFNVLEVIGWKQNTFIFNNEPLISVLTKLERAFGVELEVENENIKDYKLKANFNNESFWAIMETIKYATELNYEIISKNDELEKIVFKK